MVLCNTEYSPMKGETIFPLILGISILVICIFASIVILHPLLSAFGTGTGRNKILVSSAVVPVPVAIDDHIIGLSEDGTVHSQEEGAFIDIAHMKPLAHRGVWMFIFDESTKSVLFIRRSNTTVTCPGTWVASGEHCRPGEAYRDTAIRGILEELQVLPKDFQLTLMSPPELFIIVYDNGRIDRQWTSTFLVHLQASSVKLDLVENDAMLWVSLDDVETWLRSCPLGACISCQSQCTILQAKPENSSVVLNNFAELHVRYLKRILK